IPGFLESLRRISIPVSVFFLDNNSSDGSPDVLAEALPSLPFRTHLLRSRRNNGFAGGMNRLAGQSQAEFIFILNPDTELDAGCLEKLLARADADNRVAICEARQYPREHPKAFDPETGETSWCSGAAALIRREAFDEAGGFDERLYFMYCEDVDLSWKLWLRGWKCVYVRDAAVRHFTQDLQPGKSRTMENYFSFRNSLFLFYRFGTKNDVPLIRSFLVRRFLSSSYSVRSKFLFAIALLDHIRYIPYLFSSRDGNASGHPWVRLRESSLSH
ncbi:MAG TPA: glycosyltransferase family 2 protein, partial [Terriglobia bacterium]|nr:glycosyltransferase family 2 protein [Terriglobia bacterium]